MGTLLWPLRWLIEAVLVFWHGLFTTLGLDADSGLTWFLALAGVLIVLRSALLPLTISGARGARRLASLTPELRKIREGRILIDASDRAAIEAETTALYKSSGIHPLRAVIPNLIQVPFFIALYFVLRNAADGGAGAGLLTSSLTSSFRNATFFGASLHDNLFATGSDSLLVGLAVVLITTFFQFLVQFIAFRAATPPEQMSGLLSIGRKIPMVIIPVIFLATTLAVQLALALYLLASSIWALGQMLLLNRILGPVQQPTQPETSA